MTNVFGPKPVNAYRNKCKNHTICAFLKARAGGEKPRQVPIRARPQKTEKAPGASAKTNPRRKSRRRLAVRR
jgi:ribosomal protein L44E